MKLGKIISALLAICLLSALIAVPAAADGTATFHVDSINGTRWADYICVYRDVVHTGQNEWGENVVVDKDGTVTDKIPGGDSRGKNLAVPDGGLVVSGTGDIGKEMYAAAEIGDKCLFDEYTMRVYFSSGEIDPFYTQALRVTGYNDVRWSDTVIIYDKSGEKTGTNVYGYEVCIGADGYIISAGGNDNTVPDGGYVISATETKDTDILKMYFTVGAKCELKESSVTARYSSDELARTASAELSLLNEKLALARSQYKLLDYSAIEKAVSEIEIGDITTLEARNAVIAKLREIEPLLVESRMVETRSVWYTPTETKKKDIQETVVEMKEAGINELVLASNTSKGTIIPIDTDEIPFTCDSIVRRLDILQTYIDECRANGISIVVLVPVMGGSFGERNSEWFDVTNTGEAREEIFFSPANEDYRKAYMDYIRYIVTNYDVDGIQLDYIRYPQFYDGVDAGYDEATVKLFEEKTGLGEDVVRQIGKQLTEHPKWNEWWSFKTDLINGWVEEIYGIVSELRPDLYITAAVAPGDSVGNYCQDPAAWVKGGYIDGVYVMSYVEEINESTVKPHTDVRGDDSYLVMGCGAYLSISNQSLIAQTDNSIILGADGTGYFEWGAVRDHGYTKIFNSSLFRTDAIPFTGEVTEVVNRLVATAKERIALYCESADGEVAASLNGIASALPDENADKAAIETAIDGITDILDGEAAQRLTADLRSAIRALNMKKADYEFVKPSDESTDGSAENGAESTAESDLQGGEADNKSIVLPIVIAAALVAAIIAATLVLVKRKKK